MCVCYVKKKPKTFKIAMNQCLHKMFVTPLSVLLSFREFNVLLFLRL